MKIIIRRMELCDCKEVFLIASSNFSDYWSLKSYQEAVGNKLYKFFVAEDETAKIVGFAGIYTVLDESDLVDIVVEKKFQKNKIGEMLIDEIIKENKAENIKIINLEVREGNAPALSLYKKKGFTIISERKNYYSNPSENALIMQLGTK